MENKDNKTIHIGLLHSMSGTMSTSERPLIDAEMLAIHEINSNGGILGYMIDPIVADGRSSPESFAGAAKQLLESGAKSLFGCWTSASRKAVRPVVESFNSLLFYPIQYEGLEESNNICYTGSCLNQQIIPALEWAVKQFGSRVFLVGSDYVFPRTANQLIRSILKDLNGEVINECYIPLGEQNSKAIVDKIRQSNPSFVFNTINGDSNFGFYHLCHEAGISPLSTPILATSIAEPDIASISKIAAGNYACWSYFQTIDNPENKLFVDRFKNRYGNQRVVSDSMATAYTQIYLWKIAVERAGSFDANLVRKNLPGCTMGSPIGEVRIEANAHLTRPARIGKILSNGQFEVVWSHDESIKPLPWLGVEDLNFPAKNVVQQSLGAFADNINYSILLEKEIAARKKVEKLAEEQAIRIFAEVADKRRVAQMIKYQNTVIELTCLEMEMPLDQKLNRITQLSANALDVERVSLWFFDEHKNSITTDNIFISSIGKHIQGMTLLSKDYPQYFDALEKNPSIVANYATNDPRTFEFADGYLIPLGISSLMDIPIRYRGGLIGIISFEHVGPKRIWGYEEQSFATSISSIVSVVIENNKRQEEEEKIRQSEEKYRIITENSPMILWTKEENDEINVLNVKAVNLLGISVQEREGGWQPSIHPEDISHPKTLLSNEQLDKHSFEIEQRLLGNNGEYRWHLSKAVLLRDNESNAVKWIGASADIHNQKETLESLSLKNKILVDSIQKAIDGFKNPLVNISEFLESLKSNSVNENVLNHYLEVLKASVESIKSTINEVNKVTEDQK